MNMLDGAPIPFQLCLDFVNTKSWRTSANPTEWFTDLQALLKWCVKAGLVPAEAAEAFAETDSGEVVLQEAIALRESGRELLLQISTDPSAADKLNAYLNRGALNVERQESEWRWKWNGPSSIHNLLWPVAYSFASLLTSGLVDRVHTCEADGCGWIFLDQSRNHSRKWCDMSDCGNREKARRHYHRARSQGAGGRGQ